MRESKTYTLFDERSGLPLARFRCADDQLAGNVREGQVAHEGVFDLYATKIGEGGLPTPYQPPPPDEDHEWNEAVSRWRLKPAVAHSRARGTQALLRIQELERAQARRVRELLAVSDPDLKAIDDEIASLRELLPKREKPGP